ncbi:hypothetical protein ACIBG4_14880 [Nonomuraea sp. NPDC050383]|uniref:hypothetical protein n=1 Tax=Nonomuraea sp. NPDC050383 TaxID=3364362 RepID=UPI0037BAFC84
MSHNVPPTARPCPLPWCEHDHASGPDLHFQVIADIEGDRQGVEIRYVVAGPGAQPHLKVLYGPDWAPANTLDIPLPAATALADILRLLTLHTVADFVSALARGSKGPHAPRSTQW